MANLPTIFDRNLSTFNPLRSVAKMQQQMDRMFDRMWSGAGAEDLDLFPTMDLLPRIDVAFVPACKIDETDTHCLMSFDVPGVKKEDIKVDLRGNTLTISGERKEEYEQKGVSQYKSESAYGSFQRSFELAEDVKADQIEAQYENGVLRLAVPKTKASKAEQIKISEGKGGLWGKLVGHKKEESKSQH